MNLASKLGLVAGALVLTSALGAAAGNGVRREARDSEIKEMTSRPHTEVQLKRVNEDYALRASKGSSYLKWGAGIGLGCGLGLMYVGLFFSELGGDGSYTENDINREGPEPGEKWYY